jgi:serine protein kinase
MGQDLANRLLGVIDKALDKKAYQELHWEGTFEDYLKILSDNPRAVRNAFQRVFDMILSYGSESYSENRENLIRFNFFKDPMGGGKDAIFGLEDSLTHLVNAIKSAAHGYGTERRILLLHGPVGSSKSTIARLIKKGLEVYSRSREGALYSFAWKAGDGWADCPMHEEPLRLLPIDARDMILKEINRAFDGGYPLKVEGELCPSCRRNFADLMADY